MFAPDDTQTCAGPEAASGRAADAEEAATHPVVVLGRYRLVQQIGQGAMGNVYRAYDPDLDREVAIKVVRGASTERARARLLREARALARCRHRNVVPVYDVGVSGSRVFVVMELVEGEDLRSWQAEGCHHWKDVVRTYLAAGRGLAAAHRAGLLHRDFKPANVLRDENGEVYVVDFGLAKGQGEEPDRGSEVTIADSGSTLSNTLTASGQVLGTPAYMALEQAKGEAGDARSDQFSFCVSLFEALYGQRPFQGRSRIAVARAMRDGCMWMPPRSQSMPTALLRILRKGLRARIERRWADMETLLAELERVLEGGDLQRVSAAPTLIA